jgi:hypothetical protein
VVPNSVETDRFTNWFGGDDASHGAGYLIVLEIAASAAVSANLAHMWLRNPVLGLFVLS